MKIVLDTNVLIDGLKDEHSYEGRIIAAVAAGDLEAFANRKTIQENKLILDRLTENGKTQLSAFFDKLQLVSTSRRLHVVTDPEDNKILESAVTAKADFLITSDYDLLQLKNFQKIKILTPLQFWDQYKDEGMDFWKQWTSYIKNNG